MQVYLYVLAVLLFVVFMKKAVGLNSKTLVVISAIALIFVAGFRYKVGTDYSVYISNYDVYKESLFSDLSRFGLKLIAVISRLIYDDYATWFFLMSFFTVTLAMVAIYKYSDTPEFSILLYLFLGCWHLSFNIVKQCAAAVVLLVGQKYLFEEKFSKWMLICLLGSLFHVSALLMIPVYFLLKKRVSIKQILLLCFIGLVLYFNYDRLFDLMEFLKEGEGVTSITSAVGEPEVNRLRVLVACSPVLLMLFYKPLYDESDVQMRVWTNMSILNAVLYVASMNSVYLTRFCVYTDIFNIFFLPKFFSKMDIKLEKSTLVIICLALYCIFWWTDLSKGSTTQVFHWIFER